MSTQESVDTARAVRALVQRIQRDAARLHRNVAFMEVCGTHTHAIARAGIRRMLPANVRLISGPGCPVCVTPIDYMDRAVALARRADTIVATFGDLVRVPSSASSLERESAAGHDVRIVYSPRDALRLARENPQKLVVFLAVGFETTLPGIAAMLEEAERLQLPNVLILAGAKLIEPPLRALITEGEVGVDGFLLPGHVSVILGSDFYAFLERELEVPGVIAGFKPLEILSAVSRLLELVLEGRFSVENLYPRAVTAQGNPVARAMLERWFEPEDSRWRGLGEIPLSGLRLREPFAHRDANRLELNLDPPREPRGCRCGDVLKGKIEPHQCPLFDRACTPLTPVGACMVSSEGTCAAWHRHERLEVAR